QVHWQANGRPSPPAAATVAGESVLFVDPAEIPAHTDVAKLGQVLAATPRRGQWHELMVNLAAFTRLRSGARAAPTPPPLHPPRAAESTRAAHARTGAHKAGARGGRLSTETPKTHKPGHTRPPRRAPGDYPLAQMVTARITQARAEQDTGTNPLGLMFPSPCP